MLSLAGCGLKGPLYFPPEQPAPVKKNAATKHPGSASIIRPAAIAAVIRRVIEGNLAGCDSMAAAPV
ncbi:LPS translocon maturation chaperone LptM [Dickeya ananatis]